MTIDMYNNADKIILEYKNVKNRYFPIFNKNPCELYEKKVKYSEAKIYTITR